MSRRDAPIVVGSSPSAGSTLLWAVLVRMAGIASGGELAVLDRPALFDLPATALREDFPRVLKAAPQMYVSGTPSTFFRAPEWSVGRDEVIEMAQGSESWGDLLRAFFPHAVERQGGHRWLEKTPGNVYAFSRTLEAFPDALLVQVVRDGRDVVHSLCGRGASPFRAVSRWFVSVLAGRRAPSPNEHVLRYEELAHEPQRTLETLCAFLDEPFDPAILEPQASPEAVVHSSWVTSPEQAITPVAVGRYRSGDVDQYLAHLAAVRISPAGRELVLAAGAPDPGDVTALDLLHELGYGDDGAPRELTGAERAIAADDVAAFEAKQRARHGEVVYPIPTELV